MVPLGPRFVFSTSWRPLAAFMFMNNAADLFIVSAFALSVLTAMIAEDITTIATLHECSYHHCKAESLWSLFEF
jgi:hypothetical protein